LLTQLAQYRSNADTDLVQYGVVRQAAVHVPAAEEARLLDSVRGGVCT
jgi:hypothetical protein